MPENYKTQQSLFQGEAQFLTGGDGREHSRHESASFHQHDRV